MVEQITPARPRVDPGLILKLQGYRRIEAVSPVVCEAATRMAAMAEALVEPRAWLARGRIIRIASGGSVLLAGGITFHSPVLARRLAQAVEVAIVLLTVGPELEGRAQGMIRDGQYVDGLLLDTAGWVVIEILIKEIRRRLAAEARAQGLRLTARMAPGFGDWGLEQQRALFSAFDGGAVSVRLNEACVMVPLKSVSWLCGLVPAEAR